MKYGYLLTVFHIAVTCLGGSPPFALSLHSGITVIGKIITQTGDTKNRLAPLVGFGVTYLLTSSTAIFGRVDYTSRGAQLIGGDSAAASFIDVPLGFSFHHGSWFFENETFVSSLGVYFSFPTSHLTTDSQTIQSSRRSVGGFANLSSHFPVSESWYVGPQIWTKVGLTRSFDESSIGNLKSILELGIGIFVAYH